MTEPEPCAENGCRRLHTHRGITARNYECRVCGDVGCPGALIDGDDTELRAIFGEPVEGRDFTRIDGSRRGTEAAP